MTSGTRRNGLPRTNTLKIDKDCFANPKLNAEYVRTILDICRKYGIRVQWIRSSKSKHGIHFYIRIRPSVTAETANSLQYLLGDDSKRVEFNRARIESNLAEWNKLFERPNAKIGTIYRSWARRTASMDVEVHSYRFTS